MGESLIGLYEASRSPGVCRDCHAKLDWYETPLGKQMPMNAGSVPRCSEKDRDWRVIAWFSNADTHWATCPAADRVPLRGDRDTQDLFE